MRTTPRHLRKAFGSTLAALLVPTAVLAGGQHAGGHGHDATHEESRSQVDRTIEITAESMGFHPSTIRVSQGETVRFEIRNTGDLVHEFNIGTPAQHRTHRKEMRHLMEDGVLTATSFDPEKHHGDDGMVHEHANSVLLEPGETRTLTWTFEQPGQVDFACNVPGHYQAGMRGEIEPRGDV
ncbi:MAG: cupredoxin domain-containing protein [Candidatus Competibacterales bacterium]|nr:cupredoxin domain-containing protein [Candidatus Competibacterales bacterium]